LNAIRPKSSGIKISETELLCRRPQTSNYSQVSRSIFMLISPVLIFAYHKILKKNKNKKTLGFEK
jgi:hypothetical protein